MSSGGELCSGRSERPARARPWLWCVLAREENGENGGVLGLGLQNAWIGQLRAAQRSEHSSGDSARASIETTRNWGEKKESRKEQRVRTGRLQRKKEEGGPGRAGLQALWTADPGRAAAAGARAARG
jgi:hypothetical protein